MIRRTMNPAALNAVANHPAVRPFLMGEGKIDLSDVLANPANIALQTAGGGWVLTQVSPATYEVHSMFLPEVRGATVRKALGEALEYVFTHTDAVRLLTRLPKGNVPARALARIAGFRTWFVKGEDEYAQLAIEDWIQASPACHDAGEWFHERLEAAKEVNGSVLPVHDDDPCHDHAVGAAVLMCRAGNAAKGVWHYNAWARFAGYAPVTLVSVSPLVIDVVDAVLEGPDMEVLLCR